MKKNELMKAVLSALVFVSSTVMAADYPASDFKPKIVYSDSSATASAGTSSKSAAKTVEQEAADPKFPAASFQPKVVFNDESYSHSGTAPKAPNSSKSSVSSSGSDADLGGQAGEPAASGSNNNLIGLLVLAAVGFFLYKQNFAGNAGAKKAAQVAGNAGDSTGVEKYLEKQGINKTGVAKYLDKQGANPATGVAKYMAKQIVKDKQAAAEKATGVEKYLRKNG